MRNNYINKSIKYNITAQKNMNAFINIITDTDHLVHMQSIPSVCPGAPKKKMQNGIFNSTTTKAIKKLF